MNWPEALVYIFIVLSAFGFLAFVVSSVCKREEVSVMDRIKMGDCVCFVDSQGRENMALVTAIHSNWEKPAINVVCVSQDETKSDVYGRQIERFTSIPHASNQAANGYFWR